MQRLLTLCVTAVTCALCLAGEATLKQGPEVKPTSWKFTFTPLKVDCVVVERVSGQGRLDWYLLYAVTNDTNKPRFYNPHLVAELFDTEKASRADPLLTELGLGKPHCVKQVSLAFPEVEEAVERQRGERFLGPADLVPLRKEILGKKGEQRAEAMKKLQDFLTLKPKETRRCIATFGPLDPRAHVVKIYVRNLTDTVIVAEKDGKRLLREYVLLVTYRIPGDEFGRSEDRFYYVGRKWIAVEREIPAAAGAKNRTK